MTYQELRRVYEHRLTEVRDQQSRVGSILIANGLVLTFAAVRPTPSGGLGLLHAAALALLAAAILFGLLALWPGIQLRTPPLPRSSGGLRIRRCKRRRPSPGNRLETRTHRARTRKGYEPAALPDQDPTGLHCGGCCDSRGHRVCQPSLSSQQTSVDPNSVFCHRLREDRKGRLVAKSDGLPHVPKFLLASAVRATGGLGGLPRTQAHSDPYRRRALLATSDQ